MILARCPQPTARALRRMRAEAPREEIAAWKVEVVTGIVELSVLADGLRVWPEEVRQ